MLTGTFTAIVTPFTASGEVDFEKLFCVLEQDGYRGKFVVEQEDAEKELRQLNSAKAVSFLLNEEYRKKAVLV